MSDAGLSDDLLARVAELEAELAAARRYEARFAEIERENHDLASLYVASYQLHATLDPREVLRTVVEILVNFVGAKTFAVYVVDEQAQRLRPLAAQNAERQALPQPALDEPGLAEQALAERPSYAASLAGAAPRAAEPLVVVPLRMSGRNVGAIAVWELLAHKTALDEVDYELFNLLGAHAASALEAARLSAAGGGRGLGSLPDLL